MCCGVARLHGDHELVAGERLRRAGEAADLVHVARVGGGKHVRRRSLLQLGHQVVAAGEVEADLHLRVRGREVAAQLGEGVRQRRRGEHAELARLAGGRVRRRAAGGGQQGQGHEQRGDGEDESRRGGGAKTRGRHKHVPGSFPSTGRSGRFHPGPRRRPHIAAPRSVRGTAPRPSCCRRAKGLEMDLLSGTTGGRGGASVPFTPGRVRYGDAARPRKGGTQMALLIIDHVVGDYETFKEVFLDDQARRRRLGRRALACTGSTATRTTSGSCWSSRPCSRPATMPRDSSCTRRSVGDGRSMPHFEVLEPSWRLTRTPRRGFGR